ncbi:methyl coenzyme M reductase system, component A2 [Thermoplasmatales archaeon BRNA1]|nr:methyl coenzyme M reductase system, component A2 [Thermoplasmatales archaeon BRNA1]
MSRSVELITIDNVSKVFDGNVVLKDFSTTIKTGEIIGLIGRSGSGKSVLLHMLRGNADYKPDKGRVIYHVNRCCSCGNLDVPIEGQPCTKCGGDTQVQNIDYWALGQHDPVREEVRDRIAIMLQRTFALFGDNSVIENVMEALPDNTPKKIEAAFSLLEFVNMTHRTMHIARDLSGGEKQRVVMARQLAKNPLFFLADEPTGTLDPYTAEIIHTKLVKYVKEHNICMIFASHWPEAIESMADRAYWLDGGEVKMEGSPKEIAQKFMEGYHFEKAERNVDVGQPMIRLTDAEKHFFSVVRGVVKAVDGVTFDIGEREVFAIIGLSGAGKTTVSRMIAGLSSATEGKVEVRIGDDWVDMGKEGVEGRGRATPYIGILHQEYTLYPFDTVLENLTTCIGVNMPAELARMKAIQVLMSVGFDKKEVNRILEAYPDTLSVGECQRIAFAQVLIKEPRLVILDEPTGTMDPITKAIVAKSVLRARDTLGETFVVVSHDMDFILNCCDRSVYMKGGKVIAQGLPADIIKQFDFEGNDDEDSMRAKEEAAAAKK